MKKIVYIVLMFLLSFLSIQNVIWWDEATNTDDFGRKWNITNVAEQRWSHEGFAAKMIQFTKEFLDSHANLWEWTSGLWDLEAKLNEDGTCWWCGIWTLYWDRGATTSWKFLKLWCWNHLLATFEYACPDIPPAFSCEDLEVQWNWAAKKKNVDWEIVIYASSSIEIKSWLKVTKVWEYDCKKYTADRMVLSMWDWTYSSSIPERLSEWDINLAWKNIVVRNWAWEIITEKLWVYDLKFDLYSDRVGKWPNTAGGNWTCKIRVIADNPDLCWVNSDWSWNSNWNGKLDPWEECEYNSGGTKIWTWWDATPWCDENCQMKNYCGDWVINNNEECEPNLPETWWFGWCDQDCKKINWDCWNGDWDEETEPCDYTDKPEWYPNAWWYNNGLSNKGWWTWIDWGVWCSEECEPLWEKPWIKLLKYSDNDDDLDWNTDDSNETNDTQTIEYNTKAVFKIVVTNSWEENLETITITDEQSADCEWILNWWYVWDNPVTFLVGNTDDKLEPWESFEYTCEKISVTQGFQNIAVITGIWVTSWHSVNSEDPTDVLIDGPSVDILKYSWNDDDLDWKKEDSNETNDSQTVLENDKAVFKIIVTNYWNTDLENITIEDVKAPNCATKDWTYVDLENKEFINENNEPIEIETYWELDVNNVLIPWEYFYYICDKDHTTGDYTNTAIVTAQTWGGPIVDDDDTEIVIWQWWQIGVTIEKSSWNNNDQDGNTNPNDPNNDSQTINYWGTAIFKIQITNTWNEDLKDIEVTDELSPNCSWKLSNWEVGINIVTWGNWNDILEVNETIEYTCKKTDVTEGFTNIAIVVWTWVITWGTTWGTTWGWGWNWWGWNWWGWNWWGWNWWGWNWWGWNWWTNTNWTTVIIDELL